MKLKGGPRVQFLRMIDLCVLIHKKKLKTNKFISIHYLNLILKSNFTVFHTLWYKHDFTHVIAVTSHQKVRYQVILSVQIQMQQQPIDFNIKCSQLNLVLPTACKFCINQRKMYDNNT